MVVERGDVKRRRKDAQDSLEGSPKRTKVHAQRKFAQGAGMSAQPVTMATPVKEKPKMNGVSSPPPPELSSGGGGGKGSGGPSNRPNTEDFLTFLCFRGTKALPSRLNVFNTPYKSDKQQQTQEDQQEQAVGTSSSSSSSSSPAGATSRHTGSASSAGAGSASNTPNVARIQEKYKRNSQTRGKMKQRSAVQALKDKYREQRFSRQKASLTQLARKVKGKNMIRTRSAVLMEERSIKQNSVPEVSKTASSKARPTHPVILKRLGVGRLRAGLRSSGKLPPGSDIGIKSDRKPRRTLPTKLPPKSVVSSKVSKKKSSASGPSNDNYEPVVKKLRPIASRSRAVTKRTAIPPSSLNIKSRPSRKTKEAAAIYMEMLTKDLRSPDEDFEDEEAMSVESFTELPNPSTSEERELKETPVPKTAKQAKSLKSSAKEKKELENKKKIVQSAKGKSSLDSVKSNQSNKKSLESSKDESFGVETRTTRKSAGRAKDSSPPQRVLRTKRNRVSLAEDRFSETDDEELYYPNDREQNQKNKTPQKTARRSLRRSEPQDQEESESAVTPSREMKNKNSKPEFRKLIKVEKTSDVVEVASEKEVLPVTKKKANNKKLENRKTRKVGKKLDESLLEQESEQETGHGNEMTQGDVKKTRLSSARARRSDTASRVKIEEVKVNTRRHTRQTSLEMSEVDLEENKGISQAMTKRKQNKSQGKKQIKKDSLNIVEKFEQEDEEEEEGGLEEEQGEDQFLKKSPNSRLNTEFKAKGQHKTTQNELGSTKVEKKTTEEFENVTGEDVIKAEPSEVKIEPTVESAEQKKTINNNNDDEHNEMKHKELKTNSKSHSQTKFKNNSEENQVKPVEEKNEHVGSSSKKPVREGVSKTKKISECSDLQDKKDGNEQLLNFDATKKIVQERSKKVSVLEEPEDTTLMESGDGNELKGSKESSFQYVSCVGKKVSAINEKKQKLENDQPPVTNQLQLPSKLKTCGIMEASSVKGVSSSELPTPLNRITESLTKLKAGQLFSPLLPNTTKMLGNVHCNIGMQSPADGNSKVFGSVSICKIESLDKVKTKEELHVVVGSGHDEKYNPTLEQDKKQVCHNTLLTNFSIKEKMPDVKATSECTKLEQPTKNNQVAEGITKPTKPSIGDTWREAFKNAKLPKPGQLSPIPHAVTPFVRKLYMTPKYQISKSESDKKPNSDTSSPKPSNFGSSSFSGRRFFPKDGSASDGHKRLGGLEEYDSEKKTEKVVKSLTQLQYEKKTSELVSGLKDTAVITDDHLLPSTHWSSIDETVSKHDIPQNKIEQKNKPIDSAKPLSEGKHLNLPLPVEHNLRKHSPTTVTRKPPTVTRYQVPQEPLKEVKPQVEEVQKKTNDQVAAPNDSRPVSVVEPPQVLISKPPSIVADLNIKKKVNMTTEEIKGWLSDSTSTGIKHNKDCDIFKKNQCECSYRTRSSSMEASGGVSQLVPPPLPPCQSVPAVEIGKSVVEPPIRLKELGSDPKYCTETISTCKVEEYKESILSKNAQKNEAKSVKSSPEVPKDLPPPPPMSGKNKKSIGTNHQQNEKVGPKRSRSATDDETSGEFDLRFDRSTSSPARESGSELSSPTPRDDVSSSNDDTPEKMSSHHEHRKTIFQKRSLNKRPPLSKSPCAFSPENESSVYAFEPDLPFNKPFRRSTGSGGSGSNGGTKSRVQENAATSSSIAVQVNLETEAVLESSTQTEREADDEGHLFYIPLQQSPGDSTGVPPQQLIQGVAVKLDTEGPDQRVIMRAKLVTKPATFASSTRSLVTTPSTGRSQAPKPEQKVRPLSSTVGTCTTTVVQPSKPPPVVGTVQPTLRRTDQSTATVPDERPAQATQATQATGPAPVVPENKNVVREEPQQQQQVQQSPSYPKQSKRQSADGSSKTKVPATLTAIGSSDFPKRGTQPCLVEAPTFKPTEKEFQDPLEYIEKITPLAQQFGICRIIPPSNFKPECKVSDDMRFTAYNQYIHKMLYRWGPNVKEMSAIRKYLATQSIALTQPPWIGGMEVDLPRLYQTVQQCGGLKEVIEKKRWTKVADAMKIPKSAQDRVTKLDDIYCKFLLPYDTLSHEERNKLLKEVEDEWRERERREAIEDSNDASSDNESSDTFDRDECIIKGRSMALSAFYRIARNTMAMWFKDNPPSSAEVETEFWRHVSTGQSHICVHSASIDSGTWGYGFPTAKSSSTSRHPWNLKVLTNNPGSVLKSIGPLMGVTVPTLHVGMLFSACCWYRDPHTLPWIEYLHTGASKVWYGVPDEWSNELKTALKGLLPSRLVRDKPVWLPSDTAMVPPSLLVERGVPLCRTVQEPRQFVLVFPKAFTSSICTGYLVSESVYFAQPSWLDTAEKVFKDVQESCEPTIFSLEKLLFCIATDTKSSVDVLNQVLPMVMRLRDKEVEMRRELETVGVVATERLPTGKGSGGGGGGFSARSRQPKHQDTHQECVTCRATLFLSLVTNSHEEESYCLTHAVEMLKKDSSQLKYCKLLYNYDEEEMEELIEKVKSKIELKSQKKAHGKANAGSSSKN